MDALKIYKKYEDLPFYRRLGYICGENEYYCKLVIPQLKRREECYCCLEDYFSENIIGLANFFN